MNKKEDKKLNDCYQELFEKVVELQAKYSSQMIAGNMMVHALRIYKSILNDVEFKSMMETIARSENEIQPHNREVLH